MAEHSNITPFDVWLASILSDHSSTLEHLSALFSYRKQVPPSIDQLKKEISRRLCSLNELQFQDHTMFKRYENVVHAVRRAAWMENVLYLFPGWLITRNWCVLCTLEHGASVQLQAVPDGACLEAENQGKWIMYAPGHAILGGHIAIPCGCGASPVCMQRYHLLIHLLQ